MVINDIEINGLREICGVRRIERLIEEKLFSLISENKISIKQIKNKKIETLIKEELEKFFESYTEFGIDFAVDMKQQTVDVDNRMMRFTLKGGYDNCMN